MLAACGLAAGRRGAAGRRSRCSRPATSWWRSASTLRPGGVYDSNGAILAAAVTEAGGEPVPFGAFPDDEAALEQAVRRALAECDMVVLSGGTSKGAGDLSHRIVSQLGKPGILVHGVALKPGKPLCLAVADGKPIAVLPGFPTSAIFTFHAFVAPVIRARAGLPPEAARDHRGARADAHRLGDGPQGVRAGVAGRRRATARSRFPSAKGSGAVTSFSQADGFIEIDALAGALDAGTQARVTLIGAARARARRRHHGQPRHRARRGGRRARRARLHARAPSRSAARAASPRRGAASATSRRCISSIPATGIYNKHLLAPGLSLVKGWQRMQGVLFRPGDKRFEGKSARGRGEGRARRSVLPDGQPQRRRRHARPDRQAARQARGRPATPTSRARTTRWPPRWRRRAPTGAWRSSRWRSMYGLGFLPLAPEHYDFLLVESRRERPAVQAFLAALRDANAHDRALGMQPPMSSDPHERLLRTAWGGGSRASRVASDSDPRSLRGLSPRLPARACLLVSHSPAQAQLRGHGGPVRALAISPDGTTAISGSFDTSAIRWSLTRNAAEQVLRFHESAVNAVAIAPDGRIVTGGEDGRIAVWQPGAPTPAQVLEGHTAPIVGARGVARRRDARLGVMGPHRSGSGRSTAARRACSKAISRTSTASRSRPTASRWSAPATTSRCASGRSTAAPPTIVTLPTPLNAVAVARDGEIVAGGADGRVFFLSPTGEPRGEIDRGRDADHRASRSRATARWSPPPASAARSRSSTARTRTLARTLVGPGLPVWSAAFLPDNRTLVTGGTDRMVRRWNAVTGDHIGSVRDGRQPTIRSRPMPATAAREVYRACVACHTLTPDEGNRAGPTLARHLRPQDRDACPATISPRR